jgi:general secretion pathway protein K|tara:strand:- start:2895 stop:3968 length:1074 start_codon:yes stop_codon:yes gene_type:complete
MTSNARLQQRLLKHTQQRQTGVALITMLMIFAIITIMTADSTERMGLDIRKTGFYLHNAQANEYALGAEALARQILFDDFEEDAKTSANDHLTEPWNNVIIPLEYDGGEIEIVIRDLQSRYNLNNLLDEDGKTNPDELINFNALLSTLSLPSNAANNIADWLDNDTTPIGYYSEDTSYLNKSPGYRAANQSIINSTELLAIAEIDFEAYMILSPLVTTLPNITQININTAPKGVLAMISGKLDPEKIITARELLPDGFTSSQEFLESEMAESAEIDEQKISVNSEYFEVWIKSQFQQQFSYLHSVFYRDSRDGRLVLLGRTFSRPLDSALHNPFTQARSVDINDDIKAVSSDNQQSQ